MSDLISPSVSPDEVVPSIPSVNAEGPPMEVGGIPPIADQPEPLRDSSAPPYGLVIGAIFCLAVLPDFVNATVYAHIEEIAVDDQLGSDLMLLLRSLQVFVPTLLIMRLLPWDWQFYGIDRPRLLRDLAAGLALAFLAAIAQSLFLSTAASVTPSFYQTDVVDRWYQAYEAQADPDAARVSAWFTDEDEFAAQRLATLTIVISVATLIANSFAEEFAIRGLILPVLWRRFGSAFWAIVVSSALFASYHIYQGYLNMLATFVLGIVYASYFVKFGRLWPLVVAHTITNLVYTYGY